MARRATALLCLALVAAAFAEDTKEETKEKVRFYRLVLDRSFLCQFVCLDRYRFRTRLDQSSPEPSVNVATPIRTLVVVAVVPLNACPFACSSAATLADLTVPASPTVDPAANSSAVSSSPFHSRTPAISASPVARALVLPQSACRFILQSRSDPYHRLQTCQASCAPQCGSSQPQVIVVQQQQQNQCQQCQSSCQQSCPSCNCNNQCSSQCGGNSQAIIIIFVISYNIYGISSFSDEFLPIQLQQSVPELLQHSYVSKLLPKLLPAGLD